MVFWADSSRFIRRDVHFTTAEGFIAAPENRSEGTVCSEGFLKLTMRSAEEPVNMCEASDCWYF